MHPRPDGARQGVHDHVHHGRQADQEQRTVEADVGERAVDVEAKPVDASNLDSASIAVKRARINCGGEPRRRSNTSSGVNQAITNLEDISAQPCRQIAAMVSSFRPPPCQAVLLTLELECGSLFLLGCLAHFVHSTPAQETSQNCS